MSPTRFSRFVDELSAEETDLPLFHSTDGYVFRSIIESNDRKLRASTGEASRKERLVYFFYGRPAYRPSSGDDVSENPAFLPVCLIFAPNSLPSPTRIFPFDSGAFREKLYESHLHPSMDLEDFGLGNQYERVRKVVRHFFSNNQQYFIGTCCSDVNIGPLEMEAQSYFDILRDCSRQNTDDRKITIELQIDKDVNITDQIVDAVIMPSAFADEPKVREVVLNLWEAEMLTYDTFRLKPREYISEIYRLSKEFLEGNDYWEE